MVYLVFHSLFCFLFGRRGIAVLFQLGSWTACEKCCFFVGIFIWGGVIGVDIDGLTFSRSSVVVLLDEMELVNFD